MSNRTLCPTMTASRVKERSRRTARGAGQPLGEHDFELAADLAALEEHAPDLRDLRGAGDEARRFEVDDGEASLVERDIGSRRRSELDGATPPDQPGISRHDVVEECLNDGLRACGQSQEDPASLRDRNAPTALDDTSEPVGCVDSDEHRLHSRRTYVPVLRPRTARAAPSAALGGSTAGLALPADSCLQRAPRRELGHIRGRNMHLLRGVPRIDALAGGTVDPSRTCRSP